MQLRSSSQRSGIDRVTRTIWLALHATAVIPLALSGQTTQNVDAGTQSCSGCTIELTKVATLGSADDPELPGVSAASGIAIDSKGRFFVTSMAGTQLLLYDRTGKYVRTVGRKGGGPGEFTVATRIALNDGDTLFALDASRVVVFSPTLAHIRTTPLPQRSASQFIALDKGTLAVPVGGIGHRTDPLLLVSSAGSAKPFGLGDSTKTLACPMCAPRSVGTGADGSTFWVSAPNSYNIEKWDITGKRRGTLTVAGSQWFRPWSLPGRSPDAKLPPPTTMRALGEDSVGQLWIVGTASIEKWTPPPPPKLPPGVSGAGSLNIQPGAAAPDPERVKRIVTVVDVIDLNSNRLVVSQKFAGRSLRFISAGYFGEIREDENGIPVWGIFRAVIKRP